MKQRMIILPILLLMMHVLTLANFAYADTKVSGEKVFKRCAACHSFTKNKIGPSLGNIFAEKAGSVEGFKYSKAMKNTDIVWNDCTLDSFLKKPRKYIKGTNMRFIGLKKKSDRDALIEYLKDNQDNLKVW